MSGNGPRLADPDPFRLLVAEHDALRRQFTDLESTTGRPAFRKAVAGLARSLDAHILREERGLYPLCERLFGGPHGAAAVLRGDHSEMRRCLLALEDGSAEAGAVRECLERLRVHLDDHFGREERVLFPFMTALLSGAEASALARRLRPEPRVEA